MIALDVMVVCTGTKVVLDATYVNNGLSDYLEKLTGGFQSTLVQCRNNLPGPVTFTVVVLGRVVAGGVKVTTLGLAVRVTVVVLIRVGAIT